MTALGCRTGDSGVFQTSGLLGPVPVGSTGSPGWVRKPVRIQFGPDVQPMVSRLSSIHHRTTTGGSSGGESALLAVNGAMLSFTSDIGGSIRIPSRYYGIFAFKPVQESGRHGVGWLHQHVVQRLMTYSSWSLAGCRLTGGLTFILFFPHFLLCCRRSKPAFEAIRVFVGPMARSVKDLEHVARISVWRTR
jgi:Amidase